MALRGISSRGVFIKRREGKRELSGQQVWSEFGSIPPQESEHVFPVSYVPVLAWGAGLGFQSFVFVRQPRQDPVVRPGQFPPSGGN